MTDFSPPPSGNVAEFTVSELSQALKRSVEENFAWVRVRGEISGFKRAASGHLYLALKDEGAVLDGVCWKGVAARLGISPEDGLEVIVTGKLTTYPGRSKYQIVIDSMEMAGEGALLKLLEDRRKKLAAEGLFDESRKRPLPFLPEVIGVVTSPTGAVIRDILHRLRDRFPRHVLVWPVLVQGQDAAEQVAAAIAGFNAIQPGGAVPRPDLLIVARGGGSLEDLWAFNEEIVVRAAAESKIPLISAVGHETDTTLIDFASDRRAPTPTAAAEIAVPVRAELQGDILNFERRMVGAASRMLDERRIRIEGLGRGLPSRDSILAVPLQRLDAAFERLRSAARTYTTERLRRTERLSAQLKHPREQLADLAAKVVAESRMMEAALRAIVGRARDRGATAANRLSLRAAERARVEGTRQLHDYAPRLARATRRRVDEDAKRLTQLGSLLESFSFHRVLERGYAVVRDARGRPVTAAAATSPGQQVALQFHDDSVGAAIVGKTPAPSPAKPAAGPGKKDDKQGSLL
ncbi:MAG: exodeoxyribonuclease VII large subunit [Alphaproteobacteria bacterium]|nr:exodeoxyribonuclease VII large subunit [Alphaproteobacteria bacterium]